MLKLFIFIGLYNNRIKFKSTGLTGTDKKCFAAPIKDKK